MKAKLLIKTTIASTFLALFAGVSHADVALTIENITSTEGTIFIGVHRIAADDAASKEGTAWMKKSVGNRKVSAKEMKDGVVTTVFKELPDGEYALSIYWDKNDNGKLDSNMVGIPVEPYAFSNNAAGAFGPPAWNDAKFVVKGDTKTALKFN